MWKHSYGFVCALIALLIGSSLISIASTVDTSTLPLIQFADLAYLGAFRLPREFANGDSFTHGGMPITFNPRRNSLYVASRHGRIAEVAIPSTLVNSADVTKLTFATYLQGFYEPTEGAIAQITQSEPFISGLLVYGDRLYGNATIYYDADNLQQVSHYARSTVLSVPGVVGMKQVWDDEHSGYVSGYMATVPPEWQEKLGGPAVTGQCCIPIAWRTSWGPSAFAWNPPDLYTHSKVPARPLLYYSFEHQTLGPWLTSSSVYGATTEITGMAILAGTRTALYFGRNGTGPFCYGVGTTNTSLLGTITHDGAEHCFDPTNAAKGPHAYPYNYQIWAYDLNDLAAVRAGTKQPWDVMPYGVWPMALPHAEPQVRVGGIGYDASRQIIYLAQTYADQDVFEYRPIIHALKVGGGAVGIPLPPPDTTPLPPVTTTSSSSTTGNRLTALALSANKPAPQPAATTMTFSAVPTGGTAPHQFKWLMHDGQKWNDLSGWSTSNTFNWTPSSANSQYRIGVWVRSAGNTSETAEFTTSMDYPIGNATNWTPPYEATRSVSLLADKAAPQPAGSLITWTATPGGGQAPHQFKWLIHNGTQWTAVADWSPSNRFVWTPAVGNSGYRVGVWARSAGGTSDAGEATNSQDFPIIGSTSTSGSPSTPPPTSTSGRLTGVSLAANRTAPQPANTTITFSAAPIGGAPPHQFKWLIHNGQSWSPVADWSTTNTFNWTPTAANSGYRVGVWVKSAGIAGDTAEVTNSMDFPVTAATTTAPPPPPPASPSSGPLTAVSLTANKPAPQPANTTITFSAAPTGGAAPHQYKWLVHNGTSWAAVADWSTTSTFNWTPTAANPAHRVGIWVKSAGVAGDVPQVTNSVDFAITAATTAPPPPPPTTTTGARLTAVIVGANKIAPQPAGSTVTFTATPNGGVAPLQYKWLIHDGLYWSAVTSWTTSSTYNWTPGTQNAGYRVGVWVKSAGNTADAAEVTHSIDFPISGGSAPPPSPTPTTTTRLTAVRLTADKVAPQLPGTLVTFTAVPTGGAAPHQYKWLVHNGVSWSTVTGWSAANTFTWIPPAANSSYRVGVWVKAAGNTTDAAEVTMSMDFPIWK